MAAAASLEKSKNRHISSNRRWTDRQEICHDDAVRASSAFRPLKFPKFKNSRWRRPPSFKIEKPLYLDDGFIDFDEI